MVRIYLSKLLGERRMSQRELSELTGIRPNTINEWYHEIVVSLRVEHIDRICEVLGCSVDELIEVIPNRNPKTGKHLIVEEHGNRKTGRGQWQKSRPLFCWENGKYFPKVFDNYFENLWQKFWAATDSFREKGRTSESRKSGKRKFLGCASSRMHLSFCVKSWFPDI